MTRRYLAVPHQGARPGRPRPYGFGASAPAPTLVAVYPVSPASAVLPCPEPPPLASVPPTPLSARAGPQLAARVAEAAAALAAAACARELGERFAAAGHELALVGGPVRDALLGPGRRRPRPRPPTPARSGRCELVRGWADAVWDVGHRLRHGRRAQGRRRARDHDLPGESYDPDVAQARGRRTATRWRTTWCAATSPSTRWRSGCPAHAFVDPHGGLGDLARRRRCARRAPRRTPSPTTRCG